MALNLDSIGKKIGPFSKGYTWKDTVLYALGVGAGFSDLEYCYEKELKVLPSFGIVTLYDFMSELAALSNVNLAGILHGEQELIFHRPIPPEGKLITEGAISHFYDKGPGKGALILAEFDTRDEAGRKLFTNIVTVFARLDGGFGGEEAPQRIFSFPDRPPDFEVPATPSADQPLIYRLSGDTFALHVDAEFAKMAGFSRPIMHGLCTHGYACRALIQQLIPGAPEKARRMVNRFRSPLIPGSPIKTLIWKINEGQALWRVIQADTGEVIIENGIFEYGEVSQETIRFDGRVAIVTGAGAGLGRVYALELAKRGARVVVNDLGGARDGSGAGSANPADRVVEEIRALGGEAVASFDSVSTPEGGEAIVNRALEAFGRVDILINNAGILRDKILPEDGSAGLGGGQGRPPGRGLQCDPSGLPADEGKQLRTDHHDHLGRRAVRQFRADQLLGRQDGAGGPDEYPEAGRRKIRHQGQHRGPHRRHPADRGYPAPRPVRETQTRIRRSPGPLPVRRTMSGKRRRLQRRYGVLQSGGRSLRTGSHAERRVDRALPGNRSRTSAGHPANGGRPGIFQCHRGPGGHAHRA